MPDEGDSPDAADSRLVEPAGLRASTGYLLARVGADSRHRWARTLCARDITPHHYSALIALDQLGAMSQQQLSRVVGIDPRNAVPVIDQLQARGLLERHPDPDDRRRHAITLTTTGTALLAGLRDAADDAERELLAPLTSAQRQTLHALLNTLFTANQSD